MRTAILIAGVALCVLTLAATQTAANPIPQPDEGDITLYANVQGTDYVIETPEGIVDIYIFLDWLSLPGSWQGVWFSAPKPRCFDAELVGEVHYFVTTIGSAQTGIAVALGQCRSPRVLLVKLTYEAVGSLACCHYWACAAPEAPSGKIELVDCADTKILGRGGALVLNTTQYPCEDSNTTPCAQAVPVENSTWGKVKSLYAQ